LVAPSGPIVVNFDSPPHATGKLVDQYPTGMINWGTSGWLLSGPWQSFTTNSVSFNEPSVNSAGFTFVTPRRLVTLQAYNGSASSATTVTLTCDGANAKVVTLATGQISTIETGWTRVCTTVVIRSTNGWWTNFDNLVTYSS
jgi:hypothetical protein